jgi:hypothetical protein
MSRFALCILVCFTAVAASVGPSLAQASDGGNKNAAEFPRGYEDFVAEYQSLMKKHPKAAERFTLSDKPNQSKARMCCDWSCSDSIHHTTGSPCGCADFCGK